jgi:DMSO/TMAO reductase YedYZ molybdopterin-dependent catalytic subunit
MLDPQSAYRHAVEAGLVVHGVHPLNCETPIPQVMGGVTMPSAHFYIRNHYEIPDVDADTYRLAVSGIVGSPLSLSMRDLHKLPSKTLLVTLECAGNGRTMFEPVPPGEKWELGAVSTAEWTGVPLVEVLKRATVRAPACEVLFRGADGGESHFERSLSLSDACHPDVLLAYAMNGEPLPKEHGYPLRLIVPGWYAVASVKWLAEIELIERPYFGKYQGEKYEYEWERDGRVVREPVRLQHVRSLITEPAPDEDLEHGEVAIRGVAWSGGTPVARVEVSVGGGPFEEARLLGEPGRYCWRWWELLTRVERPGTTVIRSRATDEAGNTQPEHAEWNRLGYGNNGMHELCLHVS